MPLSLAKTGERVTVKQINGKDDTRRHLENLGFVEGCEVSVVTELDGNLIINVKDARIAISKSMANRIIVLNMA